MGNCTSDICYLYVSFMLRVGWRGAANISGGDKEEKRKMHGTLCNAQLDARVYFRI
jgi:hypothetical protein